jgi:hypothetical protein
VEIYGPATLVVLYAGFALLLWLAFDSPGVLVATLILGVLMFLVFAFTGRPIR